MTSPQEGADLVETEALVVVSTALTDALELDLRGPAPEVLPLRAVPPITSKDRLSRVRDAEALVVASTALTDTLELDLRGPAPKVLLPLRAVPPITSKDRLSRVRDAVLAGLGLVTLTPVIGLLAVAIRLDSPGPVLFRHMRLGRNGKPFYCLKLRTMRTGAAEMFPTMLAANPDLAREFEANFKLENDPRVTRVGSVLRNLCLDELPQLWNVLVGEMALVGPRPIVAAEAPRYGAHLPEVLSLRPGMTGLWQVMRRSETTYAERVELDLDYVRNRTTLGDIGIIFRTVVVAVRGEPR